MIPIESNPPNNLVRLCRAEDLEAVMALMEQLGEFAHGQAHFDLEHFRALYAEMGAAPNLYLNLVCEAEGRVAGFLSMIFYRTLFHTGGTALINELVVDREQRGRGLGRALVTQAIAEARARGMDEIEVGTEKSNLAAQRFYRQVGFDEEYLLLGMEFEEE